jgi:hypothetical protein
VGSVGGDGQAVGQHATDDLDDHEEEAEHTGDDELPPSALVDTPAAKLARVAVLLY